MYVIKLAAKTCQPLGSKPRTIHFSAEAPKAEGADIVTKGPNEYEQAKQYAEALYQSTGRAWVSVEHSGRCLYIIGPGGVTERKAD